MKKTIKIIDLLVKVANKEELPKRIKDNKRICELDKNNIYRYVDYEREPLIYELLPSGDNLNDYVEILDEEEFEDIEEFKEHKLINTKDILELEMFINKINADYNYKINQLIKNQKILIEKIKENK